MSRPSRPSCPSSRPRSLRPARIRPAALALAALLSMAAVSASARCVDEDGPDSQAAAAAAPAPDAPDPRLQLAELVREALARSQMVGASKLLAEAAVLDVDEIRAAKSLQASMNAGLGPTASQSFGVSTTTAVQGRASLSISQLLYDGGRNDKLVDWRTQLAESARLGQLSLQEQVALTTVGLSLERSRWRQQVLVYGQYMRKMSCLVEALESIVRADRGRASELVQAKKSQQQAELAQSQAQAQMRQVEVQLRRFVGDGLPGTEGLSAVLLGVPELRQLESGLEESSDLAQLSAQVAAAERYAAAVAAGSKPQLSWSLTGATTAGLGGSAPSQNTRSSSLGLGLSLSIPLFAPGVAPASDAARKRAEAAALQRADALETRRWRLYELYDQSGSAVDRARRVGAVLRDSELVRNFTLQQWQQLGRRSLFEVMGAEAEHYNLRVAYVNAIHDRQQLNAQLLSLGGGIGQWLR